MRWVRLLICVALVGSASYWWVKRDEFPTIQTPPNRIEVALPGTVRLPEQSGVALLANRDHQTHEESALVDETLQTEIGKALRERIEQFWQQCRQQNVCAARLQQLQAQLPHERYELVALYWQKQAQRDALLGMELISQDTELGDKMAYVKSIDQQVWGRQADILFADQYAYDDFVQQPKDYEGIASVEDALQSIEQRLTQHQYQWDTFSLNTGNARYEQAIRLIPQHLSLEQRLEVQQGLAELYLNEHERSEVAHRQIEQQAQAAQVIDYQQALAQLEKTLSSQRKTAYATLSTEEWVRYAAKQRYEFRKAFFAR